MSSSAPLCSIGTVDSRRIRVVDPLGDREIAELTDVLLDCVEGGASVSFMLPLARAKGEAFWRTAEASVSRGERIVLAAEDETGVIVGTVSVILNLPENQPHRADVAKMLVHRRARRRGIASALLAAAEHMAAKAGRTLLVLDTVTDSDAARLYARHGWERCGDIPNFALWPDGRPCGTTVFYKDLRPSGPAGGPPWPAA
ncbi:MAG TPA: GNAT family N-acetyltransferase [Opitutaceae bacterium]|nr:GNAT family N-acetyltransferase [Opitutaceae bacterium]